VTENLETFEAPEGLSEIKFTTTVDVSCPYRDGRDGYEGGRVQPTEALRGQRVAGGAYRNLQAHDHLGRGACRQGRREGERRDRPALSAGRGQAAQRAVRAASPRRANQKVKVLLDHRGIACNDQAFSDTQSEEVIEKESGSKNRSLLRTGP
jgi:hypothetical protein